MLSDVITNDKLNTLIRRIKALYRQSSREVGDTVYAYFDKLQERYKKEELAMLTTSLTKKEIEKRWVDLYGSKEGFKAWYKDAYLSYGLTEKDAEDKFLKWYRTQLARGERYYAMRDEMCAEITNANQIASAYINDTSAGIYALNHNYEAYRISQAYEDISWTLVDENTVKRLIEEKNHIEFRTVKVDPVRDYEWNSKLINKALTSGIVQGKDPYQIANDFMKTMKRNSTAAIRNARTAITSAQNGGRHDCHIKAEEMGIKIAEEWRATKDSRTRDSHTELDGERKKVGDKFSNGLLYPGDKNGAPAEVYNCRCTMIAILKGINDEPRETYWQWLERMYKDPPDDLPPKMKKDMENLRDRYERKNNIKPK